MINPYYTTQSLPRTEKAVLYTMGYRYLVVTPTGGRHYFAEADEVVVYVMDNPFQNVFALHSNGLLVKEDGWQA